jgi:phosphoglycerate dehydrogenase-like enzyme
MNTESRVAVCSRSFSKNLVLRNELLTKYENVTFNDSGVQLEGEELIKFLRGHDKAITALETINDHVLSNLPELKIIGKYGVGLDMIDMVSMHKHGIRLGWVGGVNRRSVSELVIALTINILRHVVVANGEVLSGVWRQIMGGQLSGKTVGVIGCGHVGKDLIMMLQPFGCKVLVTDIVDYPDFYKRHNINPVSLPDLMANSDIVSIHVPLDKSTRGLLDKEMLSLMKPSAILINVARGGLVNEGALKEMLINKQLAGAAFDVFETEPPSDMELLALPNFFATPHIGGSSEEAVIAMGRSAIKGLVENAVPEMNSHGF